jgi:hypothetical protein
LIVERAHDSTAAGDSRSGTGVPLGAGTFVLQAVTANVATKTAAPASVCRADAELTRTTSLLTRVEFAMEEAVLDLAMRDRDQ